MKVLLCGLLLVAVPVSAQTLEFEGGVGYVFGRGVEDAGPSLVSYDGGVIIWPLHSVGFAVRLVRGPGNDFHAPVPAGDRTWYGLEKLSYTTYTVRVRGPMTRTMGLELGAGAMMNGQFSQQAFLYKTQSFIHIPITFSGLALEGLVTRRLTKRFALKAGITCDFNFETVNIQPVVMGSIGF